MTERKVFFMKAKLFVCAGLIALFAFSVDATEKKEQKPEYTFVKTYVSNANPEKYPDPAKAAELLMQREKLVNALHEAKRNAIRNDAQARALQKEIKERLVKLTQLVERNESVRTINRQIKSVDDQLKTLKAPAEKKDQVRDSKKEQKKDKKK